MTVMRRWFLVAGTVLSCVALVSSLDAQESRRRGKWWQAEDVRRELGLTVEQSQSLEQIFQATAPELRAARDRLDELQNELSRLLGRPDDQRVDCGSRGGSGRERTQRAQQVAHAHAVPHAPGPHS